MPHLQISTELAQCAPHFGHGPPVTEHVLPLPMHRLAPNENSVGVVQQLSLMRLPGVQVRAKHREDFLPSVIFVINFIVMEASLNSDPMCPSTRNRLHIKPNKCLIYSVLRIPPHNTVPTHEYPA